MLHQPYKAGNLFFGTSLHLILLFFNLPKSLLVSGGGTYIPSSALNPLWTSEGKIGEKKK